MTRAIAAKPAVATRANRAGRASATPARTLPTSYFKRSQMPLACLVFLLPFVIFYELGTRYLIFDPAHHIEQRIIAFTLLQRFFGLFGASGRYLPAMAVVGVLLSWHIARNDPWEVRPRTLVGMLAEGFAWGVPLLAIGRLTTRYVAYYLPLAGGAGPAPTCPLVVLSVGAGVYEELVFRLLGMTLLSLLFTDLLGLRGLWAKLWMVAISAVAFSLYHYLGYEQFTWRSFVFRAIAGVYFSVLFLSRGFAVSACAHSSYDIIVVLLRFSSLV
jgi:hypothetical protein